MVKKDKDGYVTKKYLDTVLHELTDTILAGIDNILKEERKYNFKTFATKEDLQNIATKEDLKREIGWLKYDIAGINSELATHKHPPHLYS